MSAVEPRARNNDGPTQKLAYIDYMRGVAVLMVVCDHQASMQLESSIIFTYISYLGHFGVQLFFVASAYTLSISHERRAFETLPIFSFYIRRYFRIAPMYYVGIAVYSAVRYVSFKYGSHGAEAWNQYSIANVLCNIFLVNGITPFANNNIVPGGWSIGTEFVFYAIFPFLFRFLILQNSIGGTIRMAMWFLLSVFLSVLFQIFVAAANGDIARDDVFAYYSLVGQIPVFIVGIMCFLHDNKIHSNPVPSQNIFFLSMGVSIAILAYMIILVGLPIGIALEPTISGAIFGLFLIILRTTSPSESFVSMIGKVSYSMYVLHFLVVWYFYAAFVRFFPTAISFPAGLFILSLFITVSFTFLLATISERCVERPGIAFAKQIIAFSRRHLCARTVPTANKIEDENQ